MIIYSIFFIVSLFYHIRSLEAIQCKVKYLSPTSRFGAVLSKAALLFVLLLLLGRGLCALSMLAVWLFLSFPV